MTIPPLDLIKRLGPDFDFSSLDRISKSPVFGSLPTDLQESVRGVLKTGVDLQRIRTPAPVDRIGQGAFPTPPTPPTAADSYADAAWSVVHLIPGVGILSQLDRAYGQSQEKGIPFMDALGIEQQRTNQTAQEFWHQFTAGISPSPKMDPEHEAAYNAVIKPATGLMAMGLQGAGVVKLLGLFGKVPVAAAMMERLPQRLIDIGSGAASFGVLDALRADGIPKDPSALDPSGNIGKLLRDKVNMPERLALGMGGAFTGGILGSAFLGIARGVEWSRSMRMAAQLTPEQFASMKNALIELGVPTGDSKTGVVNAFVKAMRKVNNDETLAGLVSDHLSREEWTQQTLFGDAKIAQASEESRYLTGLLRGQPGATSVATNISAPEQVVEAANKLGLNVDMVVINRANEPAKGMTRMYHGGSPYEGGSRWLTPDRVYAEGYASKSTGATVQYVDVPSNHPLMKPSFDASGTNMVAPPVAFEAPPDIAQGLRPHEPVYDVLMSRPNYIYEAYDQVSRQTKRATSIITKYAKDKTRDIFHAATNDLFIMADGSVVRGGFGVEELQSKLKVQAPVVGGQPRPDLGLKQVSQMLNISLKEDGKLVIELPSKLTQEQFNAIGPATNIARFDQVIIMHPGGQQVLESPMGQQVQDAVAKLVRPVKQTSKLTPELVSQYKRTGVFNGQAAVLADGTPVSIESKAGLFYVAKDPLTGKTVRVHPNKLTILPTNMEGEMAPSNMFMQHLSPEEQTAFAKYRLGVQGGLDQPIKKYSDLVDFANSRGFTVTQAKGGGYELTHMNSGEGAPFKDMTSVAVFIRKYTPPTADLTPDIVKKVLGGDGNLGFNFPQGAPPRFGEMMPIHPNMVAKAFKDNLDGRGPGGFQLLRTPMRGLFLDLDKKHGTQFFPLFNNIQDRSVQSQRFQAMWFNGKGGKLPEGILPLGKIRDIAGSDPNWENVTRWMEAQGQQAKDIVAKTLTPGELKAAPELRKWYNALFSELGIEADYVENYAPKIREAAQRFNNNNPKSLYANILGDPLRPAKATEFWADNYRTGSLDVYDMDAMRVAHRYLSQGAQNRYLKEPVSQAAEYVAKMAQANKPLALPMGYFLQAVKGTEFSEQRIALSESFQSLLENLPGVAPQRQVSDLADRLTNYWMGAVYTSTQGMRPGLALRNIASQLTMSWPLFGGNKARYLEGLGTALTRSGVDEAIADGAISMQKSQRFGVDEVSGLPEMFDRMVQAGFKMYDTAEDFNRASVYWAARYKSEDAISQFAKRAPGLTGEALEKAKKTLIVDSGLHLQDKQVVDEFLRRMAVSPEGASRFAGKQASDVVNFLYGRGMQPRWMRGIGGKLLGQFGTWPLWYVDYLRRTTQNISNNAGAAEAAKFIAKHALVNAGIAYTGKKVLDINLGSWLVYPSVFYSGGPGFQVAMGLSTLARGLTSVSNLGDDPYGPAKVSGGLQMLESTLPSMLPFYYAGRDAVRLMNANDPTERLAALLSTTPTQEYSIQKRLDMVLGRPTESFSSSSPVVSELANSLSRGQFAGVNPEEVWQQAQQQQAAAQSAPQQGGQPGVPAPPTVPPAQGAASPGQMPQTKLSPLGPRSGEVVKPAESRPIPQF